MTTIDLPTKLAAMQKAAGQLRAANAPAKDRVLRSLEQLLGEHEERLLEANRADLAAAKADSQTNAPAFLDRLELNPRRLEAMRKSLLYVAGLADPVGEIAEERELENGLQLRRVRAPLGVLFLIFESRPNVAIEAFSIAFKSGNGLILRGGRESLGTVTVLYELMNQALVENGFEANTLWGLTDPDRALVQELLKQNRFIDCVIPRGGEALIRAVEENTRIPVIKNDRGLCHVYVNDDADLDMATRIVVNAKTQRPGVCNSMETVLVHEAVRHEFLPKLYDQLEPFRVEWHVCRETLRVLKGKSALRVAHGSSFDTEYLDLKMNCAVVPSLEAALEHIARHGSRHSESIVTKSELAARRFQNEVDAAAVYWNASTRFTDGYEFGLGGELGISTQKLHVRGPVGLRELTSLRWIVDGKGHIRS